MKAHPGTFRVLMREVERRAKGHEDKAFASWPGNQQSAMSAAVLQNLAYWIRDHLNAIESGNPLPYCNDQNEDCALSPANLDKLDEHGEPLT